MSSTLDKFTWEWTFRSPDILSQTCVRFSLPFLQEARYFSWWYNYHQALVSVFWTEQYDIVFSVGASASTLPIHVKYYESVAPGLYVCRGPSLLALTYVARMTIWHAVFKSYFCAASNILKTMWDNMCIVCGSCRSGKQNVLGVLSLWNGILYLFSGNYSLCGQADAVLSAAGHGEIYDVISQLSTDYVRVQLLTGQLLTNLISSRSRSFYFNWKYKELMLRLWWKW